MSETFKDRCENVVAIGDYTHVAFWRYDRFPYVLGSPVRNLKIGETCKVYGHTPFYQGFIQAQYLSENVQESIDVLGKLEDLEVEYKAAQKQLTAEYVAKAKAIAPYLSNIIDNKV